LEHQRDKPRTRQAKTSLSLERVLVRRADTTEATTDKQDGLRKMCSLWYVKKSLQGGRNSLKLSVEEVCALRMT
jgi:hypothetical protein